MVRAGRRLSIPVQQVTGDGFRGAFLIPVRAVLVRASFGRNGVRCSQWLLLLQIPLAAFPRSYQCSPGNKSSSGNCPPGAVRLGAACPGLPSVGSAVCLCPGTRRMVLGQPALQRTNLDSLIFGLRICLLFLIYRVFSLPSRDLTSKAAKGTLTAHGADVSFCSKNDV